MSKHVGDTISACAQTLYALKTLRAHEMKNSCLQTVFKSVAVAKLQYGANAWRGFATPNDINRITAYLKKSVRAGFYAQTAPSFKDISLKSDSRLFKSMYNNCYHTLYNLLPPKSAHCYNLRQRQHNLVLPVRTSSINDKNFIMRMLFVR
jgi:hypothetical protein